MEVKGALTQWMADFNAGKTDIFRRHADGSWKIIRYLAYEE